MIILMKPSATPKQVQKVINKVLVEGRKYHVHNMRHHKKMISIEGASMGREIFRILPGVTEAYDLVVNLPPQVDKPLPAPYAEP